MADKPARYPRLLPWLALGGAMLVFGALFGWYIDVQTNLDDFFFAENGPIEGLQSAVILAPIFVFAARTWRGRGPVALICAVLAFIMLHVLMRETPRCDSSFYPGGVCLYDPTKYALSAVFSVILLVVFLWRRNDVIDALKPRWSFLFWPLGVAFVLLVAAEMMERRHMEGIEETLEMMSYLYTAACSVWIYHNT